MYISIGTFIGGAIISWIIAHHYHKASYQKSLWKNDLLRVNLMTKYAERVAEGRKKYLKEKLLKKHRENSIELADNLLEDSTFSSTIFFIDEDFDVVYRKCPECCGTATYKKIGPLPEEYNEDDLSRLSDNYTIGCDNCGHEIIVIDIVTRQIPDIYKKDLWEVRRDNMNLRNEEVKKDGFNQNGFTKISTAPGLTRI